MPKKYLVEANTLTKLLSFFSKNSDNSDKLKKVVDKTKDQKIQQLYSNWLDSNTKLLMTIRNSLISTGSDTKEVDAMLKKRGVNI